MINATFFVSHVFSLFLQNDALSCDTLSFFKKHVNRRKFET